MNSAFLKHTIIAFLNNHKNIELHIVWGDFPSFIFLNLQSEPALLFLSPEIPHIGFVFARLPASVPLVDSGWVLLGFHLITQSWGGGGVGIVFPAPEGNY